ncbi:cytochrome c oxidase subunit 4 [Dermatophilus congolensis]|uniref:Cytochrome c oxidase polypeptide 4 n=1 Tax=Dermatophilus congolensis TaxID=1863 RepID=A0A239VNI3_9MICO|nr:cytochrome c oxidase subunit 4 [Dermatophilus congolensis]MBO3129625.1 cytochrome c oxidase subunit 4 [Dermatophilus congolensis]MBO3131742.1 cytochrome c oxidase subunit 4 [Dermatophilus congolensis]MBO3134101.1 cytochrome c oxidase subunit 4 [Dermatophilus congolensis]MBO3136333.1 cytochrome c oxidase subunit 4 [Dermatophilus congolensis]MBO3138581.1 cytochrome c oxidase subunit 4 [Dermatophilus congolensis]
MREVSNVFTLMAIFFLPIAVLYTFWTNATGQIEWTGSVALWLLCIMSLMGTFGLRSASKKLDEDPADNPRADIAEAAGDYGFFSPGSGWPVFLAFGATTVFAGLAIGWWMFIIGVVFSIVALLGWCFEYFRGDVI